MSSPMASHINCLIFDLGDVVVEYNFPPDAPLSRSSLRTLFRCSAWLAYEKGRLTQQECVDQAAREIGASTEDISATIEIIREALTIRPYVVDLIRELKPHYKIFAMSNISAPDWEYTRRKFPECEALFEHVFTSASVGERKPNLGFYRQVIQETGADPSRTVFIDDKLENVLSARSLGISGIVYDDFENVERALRNFCGDPITRGQAFLQANAGAHLTYAEDGRVVYDNFNPLLILEATGDPSLAEHATYDGSWNFIHKPSDLVTSIPDDTDTTALALTIVPHSVSDATKHRVMDHIISLKSSNSIVPVYFTSERPRIDAVVCVNVLTMFHQFGRGGEVQETLQWVEGVLLNRAYLDGTYYYSTAEAFLFFVARLLRISAEVREHLGAVFQERCRERVGMPGDALALAMRVVCCVEYDVDVSMDAQRLRELQEVDGGWKDGWLYKLPSAGLSFANRGLTTALAVKALKMLVPADPSIRAAL